MMTFHFLSWQAPFLSLFLLMLTSSYGSSQAFSEYRSVVVHTDRPSSKLSNANNQQGALIQTDKVDNVESAKLGTGARISNRPLLQNFGKAIKKRIIHSRNGEHCLGQVGAYTSEETIPCLDMQVQPRNEFENSGEDHRSMCSSREEISMAFTESSRCQSLNGNANQQARHGRSSGSGCSIIRLSGDDASSIHGLIDYADRFFELVDDDGNVQDISASKIKEKSTEKCKLEKPGDAVKNIGVFRIENHVYAGFDKDVNGEGKMQFLDTRIVFQDDENIKNHSGNIKSEIPLILPMEVGDLVGDKSISDAHRGMETLLDIGYQITSAVLGLDDESAEKLIDDGKSSLASRDKNKQSSPGDFVSNSYHRLVRYLQPKANNKDDQNNASFQAHVDSSFLTLIPMPELPGLEVWCPEKIDDSIENEIGNSVTSTFEKGEWVRPTIPTSDHSKKEIFPSIDEDIDGSSLESNEECAYVIAMAGEFLQLISDGEVPVCIHRVIPPEAPSMGQSGSSKRPCTENDEDDIPYKMRISAPLFLRPRRDEFAVLDVEKDLKGNMKANDSNQSIFDNPVTNSNDEIGLYHEKGLLKECDSMHLWSAHEMMMRQ
ncbi:hypothetical protein ACHAXS_004199 [Conticribra weissflogii]